MKRNMELFRALLLNIEENRKGNKPLIIKYHDFSDFEAEDVYGHLELLTDSGFLKRHHQSFDRLPMTNGLTVKGHDFLDSVRDPEIWRKTQEAAEKVGVWTASLLADLAKGFVKKQIEKHTGVEL